MLKAFREVLRGNLLIFTIGDVLRHLSMFITFPYFSLYIQALGGNAVEIGLVNSLRPVAALFVYPIAGFLADRYNRVHIIVLAGCLSAVLYVVFVTATDWRLLAAGNLLMGFIVFQFPAMNALMADSLPAQHRGVGYSLWIAIPSAVGIASPYIGGYLITLLGVVQAMRVLYVFTVVATIGITALNWKFLHDPTSKRSGGMADTGTLRILYESYREVFQVLRWLPHRLKAYTLMLILSFFVNNLVAPYWIVYGLEQLGLSELQWGTLLLIAAIVNVALLIPAGLIIDRCDVQRVLTVAQALSLAPIFLFPFASSFLETILLFVIMTATNAFLISGAPSLMAQAVPQEQRGRVMAALGQGMLFINTRGGSGGPGMGTFLTIPSILGALLGGILYDTNPMYPWIVFALVMGINTVVTAVFLSADVQTSVPRS
jgi:MFS family permease